MCTVTFIPLGNNKFILTSNRDENVSRKTISPKKYLEDETVLMYPKDTLAGGTWIGLSEKKRLVCLLNGGNIKHQRAKSYKVSRGVVVKQMLKTENAVNFIRKYNFDGIEPFTIVLIDWEGDLNAYELVWTGAHKVFNKLDDNIPKIWSSATLYDDEMKELRSKWFNAWRMETTEFSQENILKFHQDETNGNSENSVKMKRSYIETVSTTSVKKDKQGVSMMYLDYVNQIKEEHIFSLVKRETNYR